MIYTRREFLAMSGMLALSGLTGCALKQPPLRIASHVWPGYEFMFLAREQHWLDTNSVQLVELPAATDSMHALAAGDVDGAALTLDETLRMCSNGVPLTVVLVFDVSVGADVLLAKPQITQLSDLAGKCIGVEHTALGALMLGKVLEAAKLRPEDIHPCAFLINQQEAAWRSGTLDAVITYEPTATRLEQLGARRLFDSRQIPNTIVDVLAVKPSALQRDPQAVKHLVASHFRGVAHYQRNTPDAVYRMTSRLRLPVEQVSSVFKGIQLPWLDHNYRLLSGNPPSLLEPARALVTTMLNAGLLSKPVTLDSLFTADFLPLPEAT
ncbi:ABC transporter substrate-binding protein [Ferriphaselus sp. R-1]|uniref:ABC transporter substrate-binding protein n=1 Tax=Ferriphaselus sp. R-1 TaxID=1485544 RepID=UPI0005527C15|nr:ABC transporter substrate-binding protein [Ferriphaselus sp. R-1]